LRPTSALHTALFTFIYHVVCSYASPDLVEHHVNRLQDEDHHTVQEALDNIKLLAEHIGDFGEEVVDVMKSHHSYHVRQRAVEVFEEMAKTDPENVENYAEDLIAALDDGNKYVQQKVLETLKIMPQACVNHSHKITRVYNSEDKYVRQRLMEMYEKWGEIAPKLAAKHVSDIVFALEDEDKVVVEHALDALRKIPYQAAPYWDYIKPHTKHSNAFVRGRAKLLLEHLQHFRGPHAPQKKEAEL